jgi:thioredoxin 1
MTTTEISLSSFESVIAKPGIVIVDAWASWCGPCRAFAPVFEAAAARHADVVWAKLDTEHEPQLAGGLGIRAIPTLLVFRDGVLLHRQAGMLPAKALDALVEKTRAIDMAQVRRQLDEQAAQAPQHKLTRSS